MAGCMQSCCWECIFVRRRLLVSRLLPIYLCCQALAALGVKILSITGRLWLTIFYMYAVHHVLQGHWLVWFADCHLHATSQPTSLVFRLLHGYIKWWCWLFLVWFSLFLFALKICVRNADSKRERQWNRGKAERGSVEKVEWSYRSRRVESWASGLADFWVLKVMELRSLGSREMLE